MTRTPVTRHTEALDPHARVGARVTAALRDGRASAQARAPRRCPWPLDGTQVERALGWAWCRGYDAALAALID